MVSCCPDYIENIQRILPTRRTACDERPQKTSHETRFVLGDLSRNLLKKNAFTWWAHQGSNLGPDD